MIEFDLDTAHSILLVRPQSALDTADFVELAKAVDPQIEAHADLAGLIINAPRFPRLGQFRNDGQPLSLRQGPPEAHQESRPRNRLAPRRCR